MDNWTRKFTPHIGILIYFMFFIPNTQADDAPLIRSFSGGIKPATDTNIRLVRQEVIITLSTDSYITDATFELFNAGVSTTIIVGYPETSESTANTMQVTGYANDLEVPITTTPWRNLGGGNPDRSLFKRWWTKDVRFPKGKTTKTRITTKSIYGYYPGSYYAWYDLSTGRYWEGTPDEVVFKIHFKDPEFPVFMAYRASTPFRNSSLVTRDTLLSGTMLPESSYQFHPIILERSVNEIVWRIPNYKPRANDNLEVVIASLKRISDITSPQKKDSDQNEFEMRGPTFELPWIKYLASLGQAKIALPEHEYIEFQKEIETGVKVEYILRQDKRLSTDIQ